jgi:hypothetical protein
VYATKNGPRSYFRNQAPAGERQSRTVAGIPDDRHVPTGRDAVPGLHLRRVEQRPCISDQVVAAAHARQDIEKAVQKRELSEPGCPRSP